MHRQDKKDGQAHHLNHPKIIADIITKKVTANTESNAPSPTMTTGEAKENERKAEAEEEQTAVNPHMDVVRRVAIREMLWPLWPKRQDTD